MTTRFTKSPHARQAFTGQVFMTINAETENADTPSASDINRLIEQTGQASYFWDIASDRLDWSENFADLAGIRDTAMIARGREFETLLTGDGGESRFGVIFAAAGARISGASGQGPFPYQCSYAIAADNATNAEPVWLEDNGVWYAGDDGRPARAQGFVRVISERRKREEGLRRRSDFDDLTGLPNRRYLEMKIAETAQACLNDGHEAAFVIIEISRLEVVNDIYGFAAGDEVLETAGKRIAATLRGSDMVARFSGARFGVILNECRGSEIYPALQRFAAALQGDVVQLAGGPVSLVPVAGACRIPRHARDPRHAVTAAMDALRDAKKPDDSGQFSVYEPNAELNAMRSRQAAMAHRIIEAIDNQRLRLAYQPIVDAQSGEIAFHEALLRLENVDGTIVDAGSFMPLAEGLGFSSALDKFASIKAVETLTQHEDAVVSVNVSHETIEDPQWLSRLASTLEAAPGVGSRLIVEITESQVAADLQESRKLVHLLKDLGCRIAIDDFGAGFTSFANLKVLPVDIIKIDGSFTQDLADNRQNRVFVQSLVSLAKAFDAKTVVEWVDTKADADVLRDWGVDYLQGHRFGRASLELPWNNDAGSIVDFPQATAGAA